jgi:hypothetical protein
LASDLAPITLSFQGGVVNQPTHRALCFTGYLLCNTFNLFTFHK